jgi:aryl-alcohol dehydrogenase-like predicted oxidoreductase
MNYRRLGRSGLQVSELSLGSWVTYHNQVDIHAAKEMMAAAFDAGVNFFDNAEAYADGQSEVVMGEALKALKWPRLNYIVSTKFFLGLARKEPLAINRRATLNRKYLAQAIDGSLQRMGLDFIDLVYCHRPDPHTPIEETVWAMSDMITQGKALYWGTSEWSAGDIRAAYEIADKHHLHKPLMEQPQYHLFHRKRVEKQYLRLYEDIGLGLTTWSPLASGSPASTSRVCLTTAVLPAATWLSSSRASPTRPRTPPWPNWKWWPPTSAAAWRSWPLPGPPGTRA